MIDQENIKSIVDETKSYMETQIELAKLKTAEKISSGIASFITYSVISGFVLLFFFAVTIFLGVYLSEIYGSYVVGFAIISAIYFVLIITLFLFRKNIISMPIQNQIIKTFFKDE